MRTAIRKHAARLRLASSAIVAGRAARRQLHPRPPALLPAHVGPGRRHATSSTTRPSSPPRSRSRRARARRSQVAGVDGRRDHQGGPRGRARGRDDEDPAQVHADLQGRHRAAAPQDRPERHDHRARPGHAHARARRRRAAPIPVDQTLPNVNFDEFLAGARHATRATTCSCWSAARARALDGNGQGPVGHAASASSRPARYIARLNGALAVRDAQHPPLDPQLPAARRRRSATRTRSSAALVDSSNARLQGVRQPGRQAARDAAASCPDALQATNTDAGQGRPSSATCSGRRSATCGPAPARSGRRCAQTRPFLDADDAGHPEPAAAVRARRAADGQGPAPGGAATSPRVTPNLTTSARACSTTCSTSSAYNPPGKEEGYLFWVVWANHIGATVFTTQDAHGPIRRGLVLASCSTLQVLLAAQRPGQPAARHARRACSTRPTTVGGRARRPSQRRRGADAAQPAGGAARCRSRLPASAASWSWRASRCRASACCSSCGSPSAARSRCSPRATASTSPSARPTQLAHEADVRISGVLGRQGQGRSTPTSRPAAPTRRSSSTPRTRRSRRTPARSCARRRCWARPTSS